jgi:hypothetical protein
VPWKSIGSWVLQAVGVAAALTVIVQFLTSPSDDLVAQVSFGPMHYPPALEQGLRRIKSREWLEKNLDIEFIRGNSNAKKADAVIDRMLGEVSRQISLALLSDEMRGAWRLGGYYVIKVKNNGDKAVSSVRLTGVPAQIVSVQVEGESARNLEVSDVIIVGNLQPQGKARVVAWSEVEPSRKQASEIGVTHESGVGTVRVRVPVGVVGQLVDKWKIQALPLLAMILLGFLLVHRLRGSRKNA